MRSRTHYQPDDPNQDGEGNLRPIACGREDAWRVSPQWYSVDCRRCLAVKPVKKQRKEKM